MGAEAIAQVLLMADCYALVPYPDYLKSAITGQTLTIPITGHRLNLQTWQEIYLCEFRNHDSSRRLVITVLG